MIHQENEKNNIDALSSLLKENGLDLNIITYNILPNSDNDGFIEIVPNSKTINEICRQKVGYMSNNTNIYIGKQKPKVLRIVKKILKEKIIAMPPLRVTGTS